MTARTPAQIIGNDRVAQLIFAGYAIVPINLTDVMRETMAKIADGPLRSYEEYWSAMVATASGERSEQERRTDMAYGLRVKFKSNEAPWSGSYEPASWHQPIDDAAAIKWAVNMSDGLGPDYLVTLTKDGTVIPLPLRDFPL